MALTPNVVVVAPGELITSTHLNNVRSNLDRLDVNKLGPQGGTLTSNLIVGSNPSSSTGVMSETDGKITSRHNTTSSANLTVNRTLSTAIVAGQPFVGFLRADVAIGNITIASATSVAYNTTSDPRTKTAPSPRGISDAAARAQTLGRAAWQGHHLDPDTGQAETGPAWDFLSSHDIEAVAPYAITGQRDAVDDDGNPLYQLASYGDLIPLLFAALADALDRIDALEGGTP